MLKRWRVAALVLVITVMVHSADASSSRERKAERIVRKHVMAMGGSSAIRRLKAMHVNGRIEQQGFEFAFKLVNEAAEPFADRLHASGTGRGSGVRRGDGMVDQPVFRGFEATGNACEPREVCRSVVRLRWPAY